jgi:hypothetical protein
VKKKLKIMLLVSYSYTIVQSRRSLKWRKFAESGHPAWRTFFSVGSIRTSRRVLLCSKGREVDKLRKNKNRVNADSHRNAERPREESGARFDKTLRARPMWWLCSVSDTRPHLIGSRRRRCDNFIYILEQILRFLNLQLQRQRCRRATVCLE